MSNGLPEPEEYMRSRESTFAEIYAALDRGEEETEEHGDLHEALDNMPLSVEIARTVEILLGTGGPHDELQVDVDRDGNITEVRYFYVWGGDRGTFRVKEGTPFYRYAEQQVDLLREIGRLS